MNDLKIQGIMLLLISMVCIPVGWFAMFSDNLFALMLGVSVFAGGVGAFAFGYIFIKFSVLKDGWW